MLIRKNQHSITNSVNKNVMKNYFIAAFLYIFLHSYDSISIIFNGFHSNFVNFSFSIFRR